MRCDALRDPARHSVADAVRGGVTRSKTYVRFIPTNTRTHTVQAQCQRCVLFYTQIQAHTRQRTSNTEYCKGEPFSKNNAIYPFESQQ